MNKYKDVLYSFYYTSAISSIPKGTFQISFFCHIIHEIARFAQYIKSLAFKSLEKEER